jgi:hypothetical protein
MGRLRGGQPKWQVVRVAAGSAVAEGMSSDRPDDIDAASGGEVWDRTIGYHKAVADVLAFHGKQRATESAWTRTLPFFPPSNLPNK